MDWQKCSGIKRSYLVSLYGNLFPSSLPLRPTVALCDLCYRIGGNVGMRT
ncbi:hypothetical protein SD15574_5012 [Shigella dysenteriae 155-74]|nr:hypothetical protein SD15574_5012 [Shigella dysenteriae 155-74]